MLLFVGGILVLMLFAWVVINFGIFSNNQAIVVSKQTTWITDGPQKESGEIDYVEWMDQRDRGNVNSENNALVAILEALGPAEIPVLNGFRKKYFEKLGIPILPDDGDYLVPIGKWSQANAAGSLPVTNSPPAAQITVNYTASKAKMWSAKEFPSLAKWLSQNDAHIDLFVRASRRKYFYEPSIGDIGYSVLLPSTQSMRTVGHCLLTRAMFRLSAGDKNGCTQDLLAARRIANLVASRDLLIPKLVGAAIHQWTILAELEMCKSEKFSSDELLSYRDRVKATFVKPSIAKSIASERVLMLDMIQYAKNGGSNEALNLEPNLIQQVALPSSATDFNERLKVVNRWFDRIDRILEENDTKQRQSAWIQLNVDLEALQNKSGNGWNLISSAIGGRAAKGKHMGDIVVAQFFPALQQADWSLVSTTINHDVILTMIALAAYKADNKRYPETLSQLVPKYMGQIPIDVMSGKPLIYKTDGSYATVYSIGFNDQEDSGTALDNPYVGDSGLTTKKIPDVVVED